MKLILTSRARKDFSAIFLYIAMSDPNRAKTFATLLSNRIKTIRQMPLRCPLAPESKFLPYEIRHLIYKSYRIIFSVRKDTVAILRIVHTAQHIIF